MDIYITRAIRRYYPRRVGWILEELQGIFDPNGGSFKEGKYYHSFYAEIADVIERFFYDVNILEKPLEWSPQNDGNVLENNKPSDEGAENNVFKICPDCDSKTLKTENGCDSCMACGYSKCDK